jgi:hypothetical protein
MKITLDGIGMRKEELQWDIIEKAKKILMEWSKYNNAHIFTVHFVPMFDFSLEVYVFYESDNNIAQNQMTGITDKVKQTFLKAITDMGYMKHFGDNITFIFDSNENVVKNYEGNYFLRLR